MQRFARVDVAEPGDGALIEQRHFQGHAPARTGARERGRVKSCVEGLETERVKGSSTGGRLCLDRDPSRRTAADR